MRSMQSSLAGNDRERILDAALRQDLSCFTRKVFNTVDPGTEYLPNWHIDCISEHLIAVTQGQIRQLIINIPPRAMKSISVSVAWPAWLIGRNPSTKIMASSYSKELSLKHSTDCRLVVESDWYKRIFPDVVLEKDQNTKSKFQTTQRGFRFATSVGGAATGEGGNILIVDDPVNPMESESAVKRIRANSWFSQTFSSRLNDKKKGAMVVVMQRLHENDLSGYLKEKGGWYCLEIPLIAEKKTCVHFPISAFDFVRMPGDILHEERMGKDEIAIARVNMGEYGFAGQYQQTPAPSGGGIFKEKWFRTYSSLPVGDRRIVQSWDTAFKPEEINDPSCCTTWLVTNEFFYLLDVTVERMIYPTLKAKAISHAAAWGAQEILIEDKASGQSLIQDLKKETLLSVIAISPDADKLTRASVISPIIEAGKVLIPQEAADWLPDYIKEMLLFPNATNDDRVDSTSQFLKWASAQSQRLVRVRSL
jgi:predicted phage terminase large subunit-like protein